jgi:ABC-type phosphate transport system substrate-binding protein
VYQNQTDHAKGTDLKAFLQYIYSDGQGMAASVNYAQLSDTLRQQSMAQIDKLVIPA